MTGKTKAYVVTEDCDGTCTIVFANSSAAARREGAAELGLTFEEVESCRRAPWADEFSKATCPFGRRSLPQKKRRNLRTGS